MKLIQGFFVQKTEGLDIGYAAGEGAVAVVRQGLFPFMYAGVIYENGAGVLVGDMLDPQGESQLSEILVDAVKGILFRKQYVRHLPLGLECSIHYVFDRREGNTWVGKWQHPQSQGGAWGPSRCVITEVDEALFQGDIKVFLAEPSRLNRRVQK